MWSVGSARGSAHTWTLKGEIKGEKKQKEDETHFLKWEPLEHDCLDCGETATMSMMTALMLVIVMIKTIIASVPVSEKDSKPGDVSCHQMSWVMQRPFNVSSDKIYLWVHIHKVKNTAKLAALIAGICILFILCNSRKKKQQINSRGAQHEILVKLCKIMTTERDNNNVL